MSEDFKLSGVSKKNHKFIKREPTFVHYQSFTIANLLNRSTTVSEKISF